MEASELVTQVYKLSNKAVSVYLPSSKLLTLFLLLIAYHLY